MSEELNELRKIAEAAHGVLPEPWVVMETKTMHVAVVERSKRDGSIISGGKVAEAGHMAFREHIATFDPPKVLALITRLEQAEQAVARVREALSGHPCTCDRHTEDDPVKCGWKRAVIDVQSALDGEPNE